MATVLAELQPGISFAEVLSEVEPVVAKTVSTAGATYELGGSAEGASEANAAILSAAHIGAAMLVFILLAQFRSFRRVLIVLLTIPLASVGVVPGLLVMNQPFGFVALLGVIALIGIVVNNAIILIDLIEQKNRRHKMPLATAISHASRERLRPILLTAVTTMAGLSPLLYGDTTLWLPFASAMISGLAASTLLTLLVVPAVYWLVFERADARRRSLVDHAILGAEPVSSLVPTLMPPKVVDDGRRPYHHGRSPRRAYRRSKRDHRRGRSGATDHPRPC